MRDTLSACYGFNHFTITRNLEGFNEDLSHRQVKGCANSVNWLLGHIVVSRCQLLVALGASADLDESECAAYSRGSQGSGSLSLERLQQVFAASQETLLEKIQALTMEELAAERSLGPFRDQPLADILALFAQHESYHAGQLGLSRRFLGLPPAIQ